VLKAKQEGQAALERARGESASLRNLANAARVLEGKPGAHEPARVAVARYRAEHGNTLVLGMPAGFVPLKNVRQRRLKPTGKTAVRVNQCGRGRKFPPALSNQEFKQTKT